ncbi:MAG: vitamin K epoxide reductase family protein [Patescibacteria group bacterium]
MLIITFIILSILGALNAGYLVLKHYQRKPLICPFNHDCNKVTESKWGNIFGVRNDALGLFFYIASLAGIMTAISNPTLADNFYKYIPIVSGGAFLFSIALIGIQIFIIRNYCFYCIVSAFINFLLFLNSFFLR